MGLCVFGAVRIYVFGVYVCVCVWGMCIYVFGICVWGGVCVCICVCVTYVYLERMCVCISVWSGYVWWEEIDGFTVR